MTSTDHLRDPVDPVDRARMHAVGLAALASLLADERVQRPQDARRFDAARIEAVFLLPGFTDDDLATMWERRSPLSAALRSALGQLARAAEGAGGWDDQPEPVLLAQGRASTALVGIFGRLTDEDPLLARRLADGGRVLDVGTGVAALARALAQRFAAAEIVGIDIAERPLQIARQQPSSDPTLEARLTLRRQDAADLDETDAYDLIWLPAPFLCADRLAQTYPALSRALRPGGWMLVGTDGEPTSDAARVSSAWLNTLSGRSGETPSNAEQALTKLGFALEGRYPTVPGGPTLVAARLRDTAPAL